jgi:hypothetical protein
VTALNIIKNLGLHTYIHTYTHPAVAITNLWIHRMYVSLCVCVCMYVCIRVCMLFLLTRKGNRICVDYN